MVKLLPNKSLLAKKHLIDQLPDELKEKIIPSGYREYDDDILDIDVINIENKETLIVKQEVFWFTPDELDLSDFDENDLIDSKYYYIDIDGCSTLPVTFTKWYKLDDKTEQGDYRSVWVLPEDILS